MTTESTNAPEAQRRDGSALERGVSALLLKAANDDMGLYPQATVAANGTRTERTPWQDGWNAYGMQLTDAWLRMMKWFRALPRDQQEALHELLCADGVLYLRDEDNKDPVPWLLMNDTFGYACGDGEDVPPQELPAILALWHTFKWDGLVAWAAARRGAEPIGPRRTAQYEAAAHHLRANVRAKPQTTAEPT